MTDANIARAKTIRSRLESASRLGAALIAVSLILATAASWLGAWWWVPALISHFRPHLASASLACLLLSAIARRPVVFAACVVLLVVHGAPLLPYLGIASEARALPPANLRVLTLNMHSESTDPAALRRLIETERPDLVALTEMPNDLDALVSEIAVLPRYRTGRMTASPFAVAFFSRWPVTRSQVERGSGQPWPVLAADICDTEVWQGCLRVIALHSARPFGLGAQQQKLQLEVAQRLAASAEDRRVILMGDLNLTPWAPRFSELLTGGDLTDTGRRRGLWATWLCRLPFVGLFIDHVLVSPTILARDNRLGPDVGSDHLPVIADLTVPAGPR
jgi:endonuclease/exonuclease/phosphatase (EEP) superfamily protein YafD